MEEVVTIESLSEEIGLKRTKVKELLGLKSMVPNKMELTEEQVAKVKAYEVEPVAEEPVAKEEKEMFCWANKKRKSITIGCKAIDGVPQSAITRIAVNNVMVLDPKDEDDAIVIDFLNKHQGNEANGGIAFKKYIPFKMSDNDIGERMQELITSDARTLQQMVVEKCGMTLIEAANLHTGNLISLILEDK